MKEIDQKLKQWIHNSIIRDEMRELIVSAIHHRIDIEEVLWSYISEKDIERVLRDLRRLERENK